MKNKLTTEYKLRDGRIIKSNFELEYEPREFTKTLNDSEKKLRELEGQEKIFRAKMDNVARNHPHVLDLNDEKRNAIWIYHENKVGSDEMNRVIKELKKDIETLKNEMKIIAKKTKVKF